MVWPATVRCRCYSYVLGASNFVASECRGFLSKPELTADFRPSASRRIPPVVRSFGRPDSNGEDVGREMLVDKIRAYRDSPW